MGIFDWLFGKKTPPVSAEDQQRRAQLAALVEAADPEDIESARSIVQADDVPGLVALYDGLSWEQRLALVDLIQDQSHPAMDAVMLDILRAPGDGDWVDLPKAVALGYLDEDLDQFMAYYNDRDLLHDTVLRVLRQHNLAVEGAASPPPASPAVPDAQTVAEAAAQGQEGALRRLLRQGASPDEATGGDPALLRALMGGHEACAVELLRAGADPNSARQTGHQSALWWAASGGHARAVRLLLEKGAATDGTDKWGSTPLMQAASSGHVECVRLLLRSGASATAAYHDGRTVLSMAIRGASVEILELLLRAGAELQRKQPTFTPLALACFEGTTQQAEHLLACGADPNVSIDYLGYQGATPLMFAAGAGKVKLVEALLAAGADPQARDAKGRTAADHAQGKRAEAIRALL